MSSFAINFDSFPSLAPGRGGFVSGSTPIHAEVARPLFAFDAEELAPATAASASPGAWMGSENGLSGEGSSSMPGSDGAVSPQLLPLRAAAIPAVDEDAEVVTPRGDVAGGLLPSTPTRLPVVPAVMTTPVRGDADALLPCTPGPAEGVAPGTPVVGIAEAAARARAQERLLAGPISASQRANLKVYEAWAAGFDTSVCLGGGAFHDVYRYGSDSVIKLPAHKSGEHTPGAYKEALAFQAQHLPLLRDFLAVHRAEFPGLEIPDVTYVDVAGGAGRLQVLRFIEGSHPAEGAACLEGFGRLMDAYNAAETTAQPLELDVKRDNVLVTPAGVAVLFDAGLAEHRLCGKHPDPVPGVAAFADQENQMPAAALAVQVHRSPVGAPPLPRGKRLRPAARASVQAVAPSSFDSPLPAPRGRHALPESPPPAPMRVRPHTAASTGDTCAVALFGGAATPPRRPLADLSALVGNIVLPPRSPLDDSKAGVGLSHVMHAQQPCPALPRQHGRHHASRGSLFHVA